MRRVYDIFPKESPKKKVGTHQKGGMLAILPMHLTNKPIL